MYNFNNSSEKNQNIYVLFIPLNSKQSNTSIDWHRLSQQFGFKLIRERKTQATVKANPEQIKQFQESHPNIQATIRQKYKLSFA